MSVEVDQIITEWLQRGQDNLERTFARLSSGADDMEGKFGKIAGFLDRPTAAMGNFASEARKAFGEAESIDARLTNIMEKHGEGGRVAEIQAWADALGTKIGFDDEGIKDAVAGLEGFGLNATQIKDIMPGLIGQARQYHQSLDSVAMAVGKSMTTGNIGALRRVGITFDEAAMERFNRESANMSGPEKQALLYKMLSESLQQFAVDADKSLGSAELAQQRFSKVWGDTMEGVGQGATNTQTKLYQMVTPLLENLNKSHPGLLQMIGDISELGGIAGQVIKPISGLFDFLRDIKQTRALTTIASGGGGMGGGAVGTMNVEAAVVNINGGGGLPGVAGGAGATAEEAVEAGAVGKAAGFLTPKVSAFGASLEGAAAMGVGLAAVGATAWAVRDILNSAADMNLSDEDYAKKRGLRGQIELDAARGLGSIYGSLSGEDARGADLDAKLAEYNRTHPKKGFDQSLALRENAGAGGSNVPITNPEAPSVQARTQRRNAYATKHNVNVSVDVPYGPGDDDYDSRNSHSLYGYD